MLTTNPALRSTNYITSTQRMFCNRSPQGHSIAEATADLIQIHFEEVCAG